MRSEGLLRRVSNAEVRKKNREARIKSQERGKSDRRVKRREQRTRRQKNTDAPQLRQMILLPDVFEPDLSFLDCNNYRPAKMIPKTFKYQAEFGIYVFRRHIEQAKLDY